MQKTLEKLTPAQQILADYWGAGVVTKQFTSIIDRLIDTYTIFETSSPLYMTPPRAARILALTQAAISDAFIVGWTVKCRYDVARPNQQDHTLPTYLCTPRHPSYISGHAVGVGVASVVLNYFFPSEQDRLCKLAEECAISRIYASVHFPIDSSEGLKIGRAIGYSLVKYFVSQVDSSGDSVDQPFKDDRNPMLPPGCYPYEQTIPFDFVPFCQSTVKEVSFIEKIQQFLLRLFGC